MPRWKALPEELDSEVREFAERLRGLVDRSGLSVAAVADRTNFSKTSWERFLNGRLLPPQRAVIALAKVTDAHAGHLITLWELAERAWSRSEMRHDVTMEAIRVAQARTALSEWEAAGNAPAGSAKTKTAKNAEKPKTTKNAKNAEKVKTAHNATVAAQSAGSAPSWAGAQAVDLPGADRTGPVPGIPPVPRQRSGEAVSVDGASVSGASGAAATAADAPESAERQVRRRRAVMVGAGAVGAVLVAVTAVLLLNPATHSAKKATAAAPRAAAAPREQSALPQRPAGVRCSGADCTGKDPEAMGCGGARASSPSRRTVGRALIEIRYSPVCRAAWARISGAAPGDRATISADGSSRSARVERNGAAYTAMVKVAGGPATITACGATAAGVQGCARPTAG
ncbi:DUF2690 domain-containing protein [Streptomyces sp. NPDC020742]|uniref:helix-turn-helix domain-containing protein n=1 Tax=Streptomyces sp. NPDC020742 TaxID=3154897 RepID=UPI0033F9895E